ncbi:MAG: glucose-6-phosphate isomerase [Thermoleophilia bacterium]|nr:glucose-6-phosphate isomerase [Thermoleophilia bacterium]
MNRDLQTMSGLDVAVDADELALAFGPDVVHPEGERRSLGDVRATLEDPEASGPEHLYTIYMDVCRAADHGALVDQSLLYGAVVYNHGLIGRERLRSQGHRHSCKPGTDLRYSEVYEFWTGHGHVYLQQECGPVVTRALLVPVGPGDKVIVPLGWVHLTVASTDEPLAFGAWCAREGKLEYDELRALGGPAHFVLANGDVVPNPRYTQVADVEVVAPRDLPLLDVPYEQPIYRAWREEPGRFDFLPQPELVACAWEEL